MLEFSAHLHQPLVPLPGKFPPIEQASLSFTSSATMIVITGYELEREIVMVTLAAATKLSKVDIAPVGATLNRFPGEGRCYVHPRVGDSTAAAWGVPNSASKAAILASLLLWRSAPENRAPK